MTTKEVLQKISSEYHKSGDPDAKIKSVARSILNELDHELIVAASKGQRHLYVWLGRYASKDAVESPGWRRVVEYVLSGLKTDRQLTVQVTPEDKDGDEIDIIW